jgi:hypothetical protein
MLTIDKISLIDKSPSGGYEITFVDGKKILIRKRRCIPALLTLIKYGEGCESDLTTSTTNLAELKDKLRGKIPEDLIKDNYRDANKPFSELWNEEGFTFIKNPPDEKRAGSQKYVLDTADHPKLFTAAKAPARRPPTRTQQEQLLLKQDNRCNFCNSTVKSRNTIPHDTYAKDKVRLVWDHRRPVEKMGDSCETNYQGLCFSCNKNKWMICNICSDSGESCQSCALAFPEATSVVFPTKEDVRDRLGKHY